MSKSEQVEVEQFNVPISFVSFPESTTVESVALSI